MPRSLPDAGSHPDVAGGLDPSVFGRRLRHVRRRSGLTLEALATRVERSAPYLSQIENGRRIPNLDLAARLAAGVGVPLEELLIPEAPDRRSELEMRVARITDEPLYRGLGLPELPVSSRLPDEALEHVIALFEALQRERAVRSATPEEARRANLRLREEMRARGNYFSEIESVARDALQAVGHDIPGTPPPQTVAELVALFGFRIEHVADLPTSMRSLVDLRNRRILIPKRNALDAQSARSVIFQALAHQALEHDQPRDVHEFLRQRVEANYFAGAVLVPESSAVPYLVGAKGRNDLSVEDLAEAYNVSYEMAGHRFTNLATRHLELEVHFIRSDEHGVVWKAYENNDVPFNRDVTGAVEGQRLCRQWGTRRVFDTPRSYDIHYQYTETPAGMFWCATSLEADREPQHAVTVGTTFSGAKYFRGRSTKARSTSTCPDPACCRRPAPELADRWGGLVWPSPRPHSHLLASMPVGAFLGVDLTETYEFLEANPPATDADEARDGARDTARDVAG
jgi:transcriptional regulator with XRE-family HTH domain